MSSFTDALLSTARPVVMEVKRCDAGGTNLLAGRSVPDVVDVYHRLGAPCLSVVTGRWFGGDDELLREVASLSDRPILKKDFVTSERQVAQARRLGASALLLTAELLPGTTLARLIGACLRHDLTPFVEIATRAQLTRVVDAAACTIAVNNKAIRLRERGGADLTRSLGLLPEIRAAEAACAVSASGIADPRAAGMLLDAGFDGLLIGTALLRTSDPAAWLAGIAHVRERIPPVPVDSQILTEPPTGAISKRLP